MGKKKNKILRKENDKEAMSNLIWTPPREDHPGEAQEDPINDKRAKTLECNPMGVHWVNN